MALAGAVARFAAHSVLLLARLRRIAVAGEALLLELPRERPPNGGFERRGLLGRQALRQHQSALVRALKISRLDKHGTLYSRSFDPVHAHQETDAVASTAHHGFHRRNQPRLPRQWHPPCQMLAHAVQIIADRTLHLALRRGDLFPQCPRADERPRHVARRLFPRDLLVASSADLPAEITRVLGIPEAGRRNQRGRQYGKAGQHVLSNLMRGSLKTKKADRALALPAINRLPRSTLEADGSGELQLAHEGASRKSSDLARAGALDVAIRSSEVSVIEHVPRVGAQLESNAFRDLERLRQRQVLLDEVWTEQRVDRVVPEGIRRREQKRPADSAYEPLIPIPLCATVWIAASFIGTIIRSHIRLRARPVVVKRWRERKTAVVSGNPAERPTAEPEIHKSVDARSIFAATSEWNVVHLGKRPLLARQRVTVTLPSRAIVEEIVIGIVTP